MNLRSESPILLSGATGYVGGRMLRMLQDAGHRVRCLTRRPEALLGAVAPTTEVVEADVLDRESLEGSMDGAEFAYYLVHSMGAKGDFEEQDRRAAGNFGNEARRAGVARIVYLGGLGAADRELSAHLRSRQEVAEILRASGVKVVEFRASIVIGSGSLSFEMIRSLVERLPVMVTPKWVEVTAQPIAIADLLQYLHAALDLGTGGHEIFEIGGPDRVSYGDLMREYARRRGLGRVMIRVPLLTPRLSSLWLGLVTPVYARVGRPRPSRRFPGSGPGGTGRPSPAPSPTRSSDAPRRACRVSCPRRVLQGIVAGCRETPGMELFSNRKFGRQQHGSPRPGSSSPDCCCRF